MAKYIFQDGGEQGIDTDFFNNYLDQLTQNSNTDNSETVPINNENSVDDDTDFIKGLKEKATEEEKSDDLTDKFNQLESLLNNRLDNLTQQNESLDWASGPEGLDFLSKMYDVKDQSVPYSAQYTPNTALQSLNNYGNIRDTSTGKFKNYSTPQQGRQALVNQLSLYQTGKTHNNVNGNSTLYEAMSKYAPASDKNNPRHYAEFVANHVGVSPNTPIRNIDINKWADAISIMEGNKNIQ